MSGWDYHYRDKGIYGCLSIPAFIGMAVGAFSAWGWLGLVAFILLVAALTWKSKGLNTLDSFGNVIQAMFVLFTIAVFAWWLLKRIL